LRQRTQIIVLAQEGKSRHFIAQNCGCARALVDYWVKRYNQEGLEGLKNRPRKRKHFPFSQEEQEKFCQRISAGPKQEEKICVFHGEDVRRILQEEFGKLRSLSGTYKLLHRLGYRLLSPRPKHYKANEEEQENFKKKFQKKLGR
jgi:transposase